MKLQGRAQVDARALGANCDACPLVGTCNPVPPTYVGDPTLIVVGESPGGSEVEAGRPFVGATGVLLDRIFKVVRFDRREAHMTNAILCRPKLGMEQKEWNAAVAACRPRLARELADLPTTVPVLAYGGKALQAFIGKDKIFEFCGVDTPSTLIEPTRAVWPTLHPSMVLPHRAPAYRSVVETHTARAVRAARGKQSAWKWPTTITDRDGDEAILEALARLRGASALGVDVETPRIKDPRDWPRLGKFLLNIGVATADPGHELAVCVTWPEASERVKAAFLNLLASDIPKVMQNGSFDSMVFYYNNIPLRTWNYDTMIAWQICAPKLKASLDFIACVLTPAPRWKDEFKQSSRRLEALSDEDVFDLFLHADKEERAIYCARDSYLQAFIARAQTYYFTEDQRRIFEQRMRLTHIGLRMRQHGVPIDEARRAALRRPYAIKARWYLRQVRRVAATLGFARVKEKTKIVWDYEKTVTKKGKEKFKRVPGSKRREVVERTAVPFNPGNIHHIRELFGLLGARGGTPKREGGADSFDANVMQAFQKNPRIEVQVLARLVLNWRKAEKVLATFIDGLPMYTDGRVHIEWKPGQTATLRWASSNPNGQNIPGDLRVMFAAPPERYIVKVDYSQLELRIVALLAGDVALLRAYAEGIDVHKQNAEDIFGDEFRAASPAEKKKMRNFAKRFVYGANYLAVVKTLWESLVVEFPGLKESVVARALASWFAAHGAIKNWHNRTLHTAMAENRASEPVLSKHFNPFFGAFDPSVAINFPVQTFAAFLANELIELVDAEIRWSDGEAILFQVHDEIVVSVEDPAAWVARFGIWSRRRVEHNGNSIDFPLEIKVSGYNIAECIETHPDGTFALPPGDFAWQQRKRLWTHLERVRIA